MRWKIIHCCCCVRIPCACNTHFIMSIMVYGVLPVLLFAFCWTYWLNDIKS
uniref:Uncharacterized protein n=1 Tax=Rhizophora mucronata TaxID=61149 RepID=A0A2P2NYG5_RHIMU